MASAIFPAFCFASPSARQFFAPLTRFLRSCWLHDDPHPVVLGHRGMEGGDGLVVGGNGLDDLVFLLQRLAVGPVLLHPPLVLVVLEDVDRLFDILRVEGPVEREALSVLLGGLVVLGGRGLDVRVLCCLPVQRIGLVLERNGQPVVLEVFLPALQRCLQLLDLLLHGGIGDVLQALPVIVYRLLDMGLHVHFNILAPLAGLGLHGGHLREVAVLLASGRIEVLSALRRRARCPPSSSPPAPRSARATSSAARCWAAGRWPRRPSSGCSEAHRRSYIPCPRRPCAPRGSVH